MLIQRSLRAAELLRENKRLIDKSIREIDRERQSLTMQEKKLIDEMKKNAKNGQMVRCCCSHWTILPYTLDSTPMQQET